MGEEGDDHCLGHVEAEGGGEVDLVKGNDELNNALPEVVQDESQVVCIPRQVRVLVGDSVSHEPGNKIEEQRP